MMKAPGELASDYARGFEPLREFFEHDARSAPGPDFLEKVARGVDATLADEMRRYNELLGADKRTLENIAALREPDAAAVVTGQQAGLFTGPLYTVYKALAAIRLSKQYSESGKRNVVPVFWVATDDHDFEEIRSIAFVDWRGRVRTLSYEPRAPVSGQSACDIRVDRDHAATLVQVLDEQIADFDRKAEIVSFLHEVPREGDSFADWFGRLLLRLFRDTGLIVFFPHERRAREIAAEVMAGEIRSPGVTTRLIDEASKRLAALGYGSQVEKKQNEAHFFLYVNGKRRKVLFERGRYYLPEENSSLGRSEMEHICRSEPGRFSPNVVLRPVVQSAILPTVDYVAGPGEVAYWAQLRAVFDQFDVPMPRVVPRPHVVLVTRRCAKLLAKHNADAADLVAGREVPSTGVPAMSDSSSQEQALVEMSSQIVSQLERYVSEMETLDPSLGKSAGKLKDKVGYELNKLNNKVRTVRENRAMQAKGEMEELLANLLPYGKPQERVFNIFPYLMESGWALLPRLTHTVDIDRTGYQIVTV